MQYVYYIEYMYMEYMYVNDSVSGKTSKIYSPHLTGFEICIPMIRDSATLFKRDRNNYWHNCLAPSLN